MRASCYHSNIRFYAVVSNMTLQGFQFLLETKKCAKSFKNCTGRPPDTWPNSTFFTL